MYTFESRHAMHRRYSTSYSPDTAIMSGTDGSRIFWMIEEPDGSRIMMYLRARVRVGGRGVCVCVLGSHRLSVPTTSDVTASSSSTFFLSVSMHVITCARVVVRPHTHARVCAPRPPGILTDATDLRWALGTVCCDNGCGFSRSTRPRRAAPSSVARRSKLRDVSG
jgi:hypothetical protein